MVIDYAWNWPNSDVYGFLFIYLFVSLYCSDVGFYCTTIKVSAVFVFFLQIVLFFNKIMCRLFVCCCQHAIYFYSLAWHHKISRNRYTVAVRARVCMLSGLNQTMALNAIV